MSDVAFLWDESFLWGLMAYKTLKCLCLPFDLVRSEDIKKGCLESYKMLFVPGGWASNKLKALGDKGVEEIKRFVYGGGNYFGICGGAGLATMDGLGLLNIKRKPTRERVPSFSGRIYLNISDHPVFNLQSSAFSLHPVFHAWWPSQFVVNDRDIKILATFQEALPDSYSSDLNVGDVRKNGDWKELEELYGINLDPERLRDEPAVVEGRFGDGRVLLSLIHFDTPEDENGAEVLRNIWEYLGVSPAEQQGSPQKSAIFGGTESSRLVMSNALCVMGKELINSSPITHYSSRIIHYKNCFSAALLRYCSEIIDFGIRNSLWFWRTPMLLQWRRGVRGLEYNTLYVMAKEITELEQQSSRAADQQHISEQQSSRATEQQQIKENILFLIKNCCSTALLHYCSNFKEKAVRLLMLEGEAIQKGFKIDSYSISEDLEPEVRALRKELFGSSKSHGGLFKEILDIIDSILYESLRQCYPW